MASTWSGGPSGGLRSPCCSRCSPFAGFFWARARSASGSIPVGYVLTLAAIAIVGWLLTVVAVGVERTLLGRYPDAGLEDRRSRHVRTKIILVTRVGRLAAHRRDPLTVARAIVPAFTSLSRAPGGL